MPGAHFHGDSKHGGTTATVNMHVHAPEQVFNSLDPSPFWDRDLDRDAAAFIEDEFSDKRSADHWHLNVHVHDGGQFGTDLQRAIENYYGRLASSARRELREHMVLAQVSMLVGITIFLVCMGTRQLVLATFPEPGHVLDEGLIILAWVALWRPAEVLGYEWVPLFRKRRFYERLARVRVSIRPIPAASSSA